MAQEKTEQPTHKKLEDAAKRGQSFKSRDLVATCLLLFGIGSIASLGSLVGLMDVYKRIIAHGFDQNIGDYALEVVLVGLKIFLPILGVCILASSLPSLLQTKFVLATEAIKLNFEALNPVNGFKKLFSWRTVKDAVKAVLYICCFSIAIVIIWNHEKGLVFAQLYARPIDLFEIWSELLLYVLFVCVASVIVILILDALAEYFLHRKDLKMDKEEVKREMKEQEGNPEVKSHRRQLHMEILSEQVKSDIENSKFILANPTHIAIGIYFRPEISVIPFISVLETNQRALAVRAYAEKVGVPVIVNVRLARRIYARNRRYSFIHIDEIQEVLRILIWLEQVENVYAQEHLNSQTITNNDDKDQNNPTNNT